MNFNNYITVIETARSAERPLQPRLMIDFVRPHVGKIFTTGN